MKGDKHTNKLPFSNASLCLRGGVNLDSDIASSGQLLAYTADFRHNIRKQIWLPSCAINDIKVEKFTWCQL